MPEEPQKKRAESIDLEAFSEDELVVRIAELKDDIAACERELEKKRAHRSAATAFFNSH